ncbi:hypothetical protein EDB92DRAFT_1812704 [Lactarius akahatsu]|uniref:Uncharacterized protein n=1 Tax=Lactarius akahatsu TaxID=416441 RepID=A0AAD4QHP4_9AGAM|nr:hypothetical protein EDB92DRAFT_1812704 [Lactarius akahatsu]
MSASFVQVVNASTPLPPIAMPAVPTYERTRRPGLGVAPLTIVLESLLVLFLGIIGACVKAPTLEEITSNETKTRTGRIELASTVDAELRRNIQADENGTVFKARSQLTASDIDVARLAKVLKKLIARHIVPMWAERWALYATQEFVQVSRLVKPVKTEVAFTGPYAKRFRPPDSPFSITCPCGKSRASEQGPAPLDNPPDPHVPPELD